MTARLNQGRCPRAPSNAHSTIAGIQMAKALKELACTKMTPKPVMLDVSQLERPLRARSPAHASSTTPSATYMSWRSSKP
jgi:hypothetical protein